LQTPLQLHVADSFQSKMGLSRAVLFVAAPVAVLGHGHITLPPGRNGGNFAEAGKCLKKGLSDTCSWFTQPTTIPGEPTLPDVARTFNLGVSSGPRDWSAKMPWRAPGSAPVLGSGCGVGGGNKVALPNGGTQGALHRLNGKDGVELDPIGNPAKWSRGSAQDVAWAINANHGGGYSYRLCKLGGNGSVTEECFQRTPLAFASDKHTLQYPDTLYNNITYTFAPVEIPMVKVSEGTVPEGSEWARVPIPACNVCNQADCGAPVEPNMTDMFTPTVNGKPYPGVKQWAGGEVWYEQQLCGATCAGGMFPGACPPDLTQFPEPASGTAGYTHTRADIASLDFKEDGITDGFLFNIVDKVAVPQDLEPGSYLLSWRWDCEQSGQIWQNCADVTIV